MDYRSSSHQRSTRTNARRRHDNESLHQSQNFSHRTSRNSTVNSEAGQRSPRTSPAGTLHRRPSSSPVESKHNPKSVFMTGLSLLIVLFCVISLASIAKTYTINHIELDKLREQEAQLQVQKAELDNEIQRWNDKAYVIAQVRDRLGFVFPGEESVRVLHPEAVTGERPNDKKQSDHSSNSALGFSSTSQLPWYKEMAYSFIQVDKDHSKTASEQKPYVTFQNNQ